MLTLWACNGNATLNYWDPEGATSTPTPNGTWEGATWSGTSSNLTASPTNFTEGVAAAFSSGGAATGTFTVTVGSPHTIAGIFNGGLANIQPSTGLFISGSSTLNINSGTQGFDTAGGGMTHIQVPLIGAGNLTTEGSGQIFLEGANTYTGGTGLGFSTVPFSGIVNFTNTNSFGTGTISVSNTGGAICALVEENVNTGTIIPNKFAWLQPTGGLNIVGALTPAATTFTGTWTLNNPANIGAGGSANMVILSGVMSGTGGLNKFNPAILRLSGANTYSGNTTISNGILQLGANGGIPSGSGKGNVTITSAGGTTNSTLDVNGFSGTVNGFSGNGLLDNSSATQGTLTVGGNNVSSTFTGSITASGNGQFNITKTGTGTFVLNSTGVGYTGNTTINQGTFAVQSGVTLPSTTPVVIAAGATLDLSNNSSVTIGALSGSGNITNNGGTINLDGGTNGTNFPSYSCFLGSINAGSLSKTGPGVMSIRNTNLNNLSPALSFSGGVLSVGARPNVLATNLALNLSSGMLFQLDANLQAVASVNGSGGAINLGGGTLNITGASASLYSGTIQNSEIITNSTAGGHGLRGYYYDNIDFSSLDTVRDDTNVNFNFATVGGGLPTPPFPKTNYISIRWLGQMLTTVAGTYSFVGTTDDGQRLWVNGTNLIDDWASQSATAKTNTITLAANTRYDIVYEYMNLTGGSSAKLAWIPPGDTVPTVIPTDYLFLPGPGNLVIGGAGSSQVSLGASNSYTRRDHGGSRWFTGRNG